MNLLNFFPMLSRKKLDSLIWEKGGNRFSSAALIATKMVSRHDFFPVGWQRQSLNVIDDPHGRLDHPIRTGPPRYLPAVSARSLYRNGTIMTCFAAAVKFQ